MAEPKTQGQGQFHAPPSVPEAHSKVGVKHPITLKPTPYPGMK